MKWFKRKYPMQTFTFTFRGEHSDRVRVFPMRSNLMESACDEARQSLTYRYGESHVLISYTVDA